jgi:hypothetical protein
MRKLILGIIMTTFMFSTSLHAEEKYSLQESISVCEKAASIANSAMRARQVGMSINEFMSLIEEFSEYEELTVFGQAVAIDAYSRPRYYSEELQQRAIDAFTNEMNLRCLKEML